MFVAGDEVRRTQRGNNNAYCQDNELSWFDWTLPEQHADIFRFFKEMIAFRKRHPSLQRRASSPASQRARAARRHLARLLDSASPGWDEPVARVLAFTLGGLDATSPTSTSC